jgi:hypothetical protein
MPGFLVTFANQVMCTHAGKATPGPPVGPVLVQGFGVVTIAHVYAITSCGFPAMTSGGQPPCVVGKVLNGTLKVTSMGLPLVLIPDSAATSKGLPNPTPLIFAPAGQALVTAN